MSDIEAILQEANIAGASDVHLTVGSPPRMRVNGNLITMNYSKMLPADTLDILIGVMSEVQRQKFEERGEYDFSFSIPNSGRYRVNAYKQRGGAALAFRLIGTGIPAAEELGIPASVMELYQRKRGLVLVAGPAGSGKTTTLAAIIDKINNNRDVHIITLEEPIEYLHQHKRAMVNQREIGLDSESYSNALKAVLREDPDVILIGELKDAETISAAVTAAETGHLVLSSIYTIGAVDTVERLIDSFPDWGQEQFRMRLANVLEAVISQQLIPAADNKGRIAVFEVLNANHEVRKLIREGRSHQLSGLMQANSETGMITMDEAISQLYYDGRIDRGDAVQFALDPDNMELKLR